MSYGNQGVTHVRAPEDEKSRYPNLFVPGCSSQAMAGNVTLNPALVTCLRCKAFLAKHAQYDNYLRANYQHAPAKILKAVKRRGSLAR